MAAPIKAGKPPGAAGLIEGLDHSAKNLTDRLPQIFVTPGDKLRRFRRKI